MFGYIIGVVIAAGVAVLVFVIYKLRNGGISFSGFNRQKRKKADNVPASQPDPSQQAIPFIEGVEFGHVDNTTGRQEQSSVIPQWVKPPLGKNGKYIIPKNFNSLVFRTDNHGHTQGWFENIANPFGRQITYVEENLIKSVKKRIFVFEADLETGSLSEYSRPEAIECLPESLYNAHAGCKAYGRFLARKNTFMEKLKLVLLVGIILALAFISWLIIAG